ncbi:MAG: hypothetical protein V4581_00850 [Bacteroidota bacterium]
MLRFVLIRALIIIAIPAAAQRKILTTEEVSAAEKKLYSLPADSNKANLLLNISFYYFDKNTPEIQDLGKASKFAVEALNIGKSKKYEKWIGESYVMLSLISQEDKKYRQGKEYAEKALQVLEKPGYADTYGEALVMLWSTSTLTGANHETGMRIIKKAGAAFNRSGNLTREGDCLKELADLYHMHRRLSR